MSDLRKNPENRGKDIKITNGKQSVDGKVIDKNTFFRLDAGTYGCSNFNIFSWSINGVKEKFKSIDVTNLFKNEDIVIICETHFGIRTKCPEGFILIGRSNVIKSKKKHGVV